MKQIDCREGARRQHRVVSLFCIIQCWLRGWDGVRISRQRLERLLGLQRFKQTRVEWMKEDFSELFPYQKTDCHCWPTESFRSLELSRRTFKKNPVIGTFEIWHHPTQQQLSKLYEGFLPFFADAANYDERLLASYLSLLAHGQISPRCVPPVKDEE